MIIEAFEHEQLTYIFDTSAHRHEFESEVNHHHDYEFEMDMQITTPNGVRQLYDGVGLHDGERPNGTVIIMLSIADPGILGVGSHPFTIKATDGEGTVVLEESGDIVVSAGDPMTIQSLGVVRPWDLLNPMMQHTTKEQRTARMDICRACDRFNGLLCLECKCVMKWKTTLAPAECPIHLWGPVS